MEMIKICLSPTKELSIVKNGDVFYAKMNGVVFFEGENYEAVREMVVI